MPSQDTNRCEKECQAQPPQAERVELTLDIELLEDRIAPAMLGGIKPVEPCCNSR